MFHRKVSPSEKTLLVADWASKPFANQLVVEGSGKINEDKLKEAVNAASLAHPGSRLVLKGRYCFAKWVETEIPSSFKVVKNSSWDGFSSKNAPFLFEALHPLKGPTSQVVLVHGDKTRIIFRTSHGTMDGRGTQLWAEDVFNALNGKQLIGSGSRITDMDISAITRKKKRNSSTEIRANDCIVPTGKSKGTREDIVWKRIRIKGKFRAIVPQLSILLAKEAWKYQDGQIAILLPVDMRKRIPGLLSTNNLSSMIYYKVSKQDSIETIQSKISELLDGQYESLPAWYNILSFVPTGFMKQVYKQSAINNKITDLYSASAVISNLGKMPLERFACDNFNVESCFFIPPCGNGMSHFMTLSGSGEFVDILSASPHIYSTDRRINILLANVENGLIKETV